MSELKHKSWNLLQQFSNRIKMTLAELISNKAFCSLCCWNQRLSKCLQSKHWLTQCGCKNKRRGGYKQGPFKKIFQKLGNKTQNSASPWYFHDIIDPLSLKKHIKVPGPLESKPVNKKWFVNFSAFKRRKIVFYFETRDEKKFSLPAEVLKISSSPSSRSSRPSRLDSSGMMQQVIQPERKSENNLKSWNQTFWNSFHVIKNFKSLLIRYTKMPTVEISKYPVVKGF